MYLIVNNLPPSIRTKIENTILCGVRFGARQCDHYLFQNYSNCTKYRTPSHMLNNNGLWLSTTVQVCVTIFSSGGKFQPVSSFTELHTLTQAACSYAFLIHCIAMYCNATIVYKWENMQICKNRLCDFTFYLDSASVKPTLLHVQLSLGFLYRYLCD